MKQGKLVVDGPESDPSLRSMSPLVTVYVLSNGCLQSRDMH